MSAGKGPESLGELLQAMAPAPEDSHVSLGAVLGRFGDRSFAPAILVPALILVSPISGIPGTPTVGALVVVLIALQALIGRKFLRLPGFLMRRKIRAGQMVKALRWLARPAAWIDRHSLGRLHMLTAPPLSLIAYAVVLLIALSWPLLELLPFITSFGAGAVSLIALGLMTRDGAYLIAGYAVAGLLGFAAVTVAAGFV